MVVGVPLLAGRVAPRCTAATHLMLTTVTGGRATLERVLEANIDNLDTLLDLVRRNSVETLVCGGVTLDNKALLAAHGIEIIENVACSAAEAIAAIDTGTLRQGYGFDQEGFAVAVVDAPEAEDGSKGPGRVGGVDCLACEGRECLCGQRCPHIAVGLDLEVTPETRRIMEAATDIALETDRHLCRVTELVYLCLEMGYEKVGIAYCVDLSEPTRILVGLLRRFIEVVPVCCKIVSDPMAGSEAGGSGRSSEASEWACHPLLQAEVLNRAGTDINVMVGLSIGADAIFSRASHAPVTALFVKDKSLANNPIGAIYSDYYLREPMVSVRKPHARSRFDTNRKRRAALPGGEVS